MRFGDAIAGRAGCPQVWGGVAVGFCETRPYGLVLAVLIRFGMRSRVGRVGCVGVNEFDLGMRSRIGRVVPKFGTGEQLEFAKPAPTKVGLRMG
jgi:hypothetical protein